MSVNYPSNLLQAKRKRKECTKIVGMRGIRKTPNQIFAPRGGNKHVGHSSKFSLLVLLSILFI
jgi:hypothetical protein